jgi:hypothetical protein
MPRGKLIAIEPTGRLANRMFQLMLATELRRRLSTRVPIIGYDMPEWNLRSPPHDGKVSSRFLLLKGHVFSLRRIAFAMEADLVDAVLIRGWGMRLEHYREPQIYAPLFKGQGVDFYVPDEDEVILHVRAEDILAGHHAEYFPMPMAYYEKIVETTSLRPVFMGQMRDSAYIELIRRRFPKAKFLPEASPVSDFQTIRHARHVALSISSFCWLAAWLSETAVTVHMPVCGMFNPLSSAALLTPVNDPRYRFYNVPFPAMAQRKDLDPLKWLDADHIVTSFSRADIAKMSLRSLFGGNRSLVLGPDLRGQFDAAGRKDAGFLL